MASLPRKFVGESPGYWLEQTVCQKRRHAGTASLPSSTVCRQMTIHGEHYLPQTLHYEYGPYAV